ncbi:MAG TPA: hypothetical protein VGG16_20695 [Streptosporangiaceae bacterium]
MSLTGGTFQLLTICAAIVVTIAVILLWNRIRGPRPVRLVTRIALLATGYVTAAVAILVSINIAYGGLIATWGDLFANLNPPPGNWHPHYRHRPQHGPRPSTQAVFGGPHQLPPPFQAPGHQIVPTLSPPSGS